MRTIRKGNDINVKWFITRQGEAEDFTNKDVKVYLYDKFNNKQEFTYTINGNVVDGSFLGKDQITNGVYRLCLVENDGTTDMVTLDYIDCWLLSNKLKNKTASGYDTSNKVETEVVELTSVINTSGEVVDLTGYVTEDELDNIMDDVYTKAQIDQKIVDVATGGDIDLGAYAKKTDVYTKAEIDSAISNVETIKGDKGDKGDPFTYEDFTQAQLASLKGEKGDKGDAFTYNDFTVEQLAALKGEKGDQGIQGPKGDKGEDGVVDTTNFYTKSEVDQKIIDAATEGVDLTDYALKNDVYTKSQVDTLIENVEGQVGDAGKSAYEIAVDNGFVGTEVEWLASLKGTDGDDGVKGEKGDKGDAFTYNDFTQAQLEALKGEKGDKGDKGDPFTYSDFTSEQLAALKGEKGDQGIQGPKGDTGTVDTTNFYTKSEVDQKVADAASGGEIDLSGYAKTSDVYTKTQIDNFAFLTGADAKATIYSKNEIDAFGFLTEHQSLRNYYTKNDVYSKEQIDNFAFLTGADAMATIYSKKEIDNMGFLTEHQSLADYFTKNEINTIKADYYTKDEIDNFGYITAVDAADTIYTKTQIDNMGFLTSHQSLANYYTKGQVDTALNDYYTKTQVDNFGFLTATDANNTIYSKDEIDNMGFLTEHQSLANYYTKDDVDTTLADYYTKDDIDGFAYLTSEDARKTIYSKTEIDNKGFLTQHQSLANYFTKDEIQEDYYDKEVIDNKFERVNAVPTKTSDLTNDSGFLTATDVYTKTQTYSKTEVDSLVANSGGSGSSSGGGGFTVVTNTSDSSKKGLVNSLSTYYDTNIGKGAVIEGEGSNANYKIKASGNYSHAEGYYTIASDNYSHAEGYGTEASGNTSHAEGYRTTASGTISHAEGQSSTASGERSHAEGYSTASGDTSHAEGDSTIASGSSSHAEGNTTKASGQSSHAEGIFTTAGGSYSHAEGFYTRTDNLAEHASGQYNKVSVYENDLTWNGSGDKSLFTVGNGSGDDTRHNAFEIRQNGDIYFADTNSTISNYYQKPMLKLQDAIDGAVKTTELSNYYTSAQTDSAIETAVAQISASGGQLQADWSITDDTNVRYIKNKPFYSEPIDEVIISHSDKGTADQYYYNYYLNELDEEFFNDTYDIEILVEDANAPFAKVVTTVPVHFDSTEYVTENNVNYYYMQGNNNSLVSSNFYNSSGELIGEGELYLGVYYWSSENKHFKIGYPYIYVSYSSLNGTNGNAKGTSIKVTRHKTNYHKIDKHYIDDSQINFKNLKNLPYGITDTTTDVIYTNTYGYNGNAYGFSYPDKLVAGEWYTFICGDYVESVKCKSMKWGVSDSTPDGTTSLTLNVVDSRENPSNYGQMFNKWAVYETDAENGTYQIAISSSGEYYDKKTYFYGMLKLVKGRITYNKLSDYQNGSPIVHGEGGYSIKSNVCDYADKVNGNNDRENYKNIAGSDFDVCFGAGNKIMGEYSTISGGYQNTIKYYNTSYTFATIGGGNNNVADNNPYCATIAGGYNNHVTNYANTIIGGTNNFTQNSCEVAGGCYNLSRTGETDAEQTLFTIGNGGYNKGQHNAIEVRTNGDLYIPNTALIGTEYDDNGTTKTYNYYDVPMIKVQDALANSSGSGSSTDLTNYLTKSDAASTYATKSTTYTKTEIDSMVGDIETLLSNI